MKIKLYKIKLILLLVSFSYSNSGAFSISRIHYDGGGDWYANKSSIPNLLNFVKNNTNINAITNLEKWSPNGTWEPSWSKSASLLAPRGPEAER